MSLFRRQTVPDPSRPTAQEGAVLHDGAVATLADCCATAIRSAGEYAIELEAGGAQTFSAELARLSLRLSGPFSAEECRGVQAGMQAACKKYRGRTWEQLERLRLRLRASAAAAAEAVGEFAESLSAGDAEHEQSIQIHLDQLNAAAAADDLSRLRRVLEGATEGIRRAQIQLQRSHTMVIAQLQDEVRVLREVVAAHQRQRERDPDLGVWRREEIERKIRSRLPRNTHFAVLLVTVHNLEDLEEEHPRSVTMSLLKALLQRMTGIVGPEAEIGRWSAHEFAVILPGGPALAPAICEAVRSQLPGVYAIQSAGRSLTLDLDLSASVIPVGDGEVALIGSAQA